MLASTCPDKMLDPEFWAAGVLNMFAICDAIRRGSASYGICNKSCSKSISVNFAACFGNQSKLNLILCSGTGTFAMKDTCIKLAQLILAKQGYHTPVPWVLPC